MLNKPFRSKNILKYYNKTLIFVITFLILYASAVQASTDLQFEDVYDKPLWQNTWVLWGGVAAVAAGAAVFTTVTYGTGAPAAATGVSAVASAAAGGGAGSYMAGLSLIGGYFGGNAIVGAAILNAGSAALLGGAAFKGIPAVVLTSIEIMTAVGAVFMIPSEDEKQVDYYISIAPTGDIGTDLSKNLVKKLKKIVKESNKNKITASQIQNETNIIKYMALAIVHNTKGNNSPEVIEDKISALILIYNFGYMSEFINNVKSLPEVGGKYSSFIYYLKSVAYIHEKNYKEADQYAQLAMIAEEEAIEPVLVRIMALKALKTFDANEASLKEAINKFDKQHYATQNTKATAYNLLGDYASIENKNYTAAEFYKKAFDDISYWTSDKDKALLCAKIARSYRLSNVSGKEKYVNKYYKKAIGYVDKDDAGLKANINAVYSSK